VELPFFVVEAVENVLDVGDDAEWGGEVVEQSLVEDLDAAETLVDGLYFFEDEAFFDFLEIEHAFEQVRIPQFQEVIKAFKLLHLIEMAVGLEVIVKLLVEEYFPINMLRHRNIVVLDKVNGLPD
jgi:hypothetical protein